MSVAGYLGKGNSELRMPKGKVDAVGAEHEGDVLCGEISVEERLKADGIERLRDLLESLGLQAGPRMLKQIYENVDEYDPVLRWHCRL